MKQQNKLDMVLARVKGNKRARRIASALACLVVFVTLWRLTLPAITLEWGKPQAEGITEPEMEETLQEEELLAEESLSEEEEEAPLSWPTLEEAAAAGYPDAVRVDRLICGQRESEGHTHTADCIESYYTAQTASFAEEAFLAMPAQRFEGEAGNLSVRIDAAEGTFPETTEMALEEVDTEEVRRAASGLVNGKISQVLAVDIGFLYEGEKIEPEQPVQVVLSGSALEGMENPVVLHIDGEGNAEIVSHRTAEEAAPAPLMRMAARSAQSEETLAKETTDETAENTEALTEETLSSETPEEGIAEEPLPGEEELPKGALVFDAEDFSVYAVVSYTVDFHYELDGKEFEISMPGGGFISLRDLVEALSVAADDPETEENELDAFLTDVQDVTFSSPELVSVSKVQEDTTVGAIKEALGLACEYSAELTEEDIEKINSTAVSAGDWALISLKPFDTEESLTVTMNGGSQFVIRVTDARKPKLTDTYSGLTIVKKWYNSDGTEITGDELTDDHKCDVVLQGWEYNPADLIRLHFIDSNGNEDSSKTVIVPAGKLQLTLYNSPQNGYGGGGTAYLFSEAPSTPITNPYQNISLLTDSAITVKNVDLDDGSNINCWVIDLNLSDYVNELTDVYLGIRPDPDNGGIEYFKTGTYPDITAAIGDSAHAMKIAYTDYGNWQNDTYRNRHIFDTIKGQHNTYVWHNNELELTSAGGKFFGYTLYESAASTPNGAGFTTTISWNNGADEIYTNGLTGWSADLYINSPNLENNVITIKNTLRDDVDVPVEKHWPWMDDYVKNSTYDWEAKFVLQWAPVYEGETVPSVDFVEVEPRQYMTVTSYQMENYGSTFDERKFYSLPLYGEDEKGRFRYQYSVEEESYTVKNHQSGAVVATYDRYGAEGEKYTGSLPEFIPYYPHDAGELSQDPSDYVIMVTNALAPDASNPTINITVNKDWDDEEVMEDDTHNYHATVKIQRYDQTTTRTVNSDHGSGGPIEVKIFDMNGSLVATQYVDRGVRQRIHITWNTYGYGNEDFSFNTTNTDPAVNFNERHYFDYGTSAYSETQWFYPQDGMEIHVTQNKWNAYQGYPGNDPAVNLTSGIEFIDSQGSSVPEPDTAFNNDPDNIFTLSLLDNRWSTIITDLPLTETTTDGDTQTIHHYSYYFVEDEANTTPGGYTPRYIRYDTVGTGREFEIGDSPHRINYDGEHVTIQNTKKMFRVKKEWRGIQRSEWYMYPAVTFDLYRTTNPQQQGELIQSGIELSDANGWEWSTEDLESGYYYYVVEDMSFDTENRYQLWEYYNSDGRTSLRDQPYNHAIDKNGTVTILNALRDDNQYIQIEVQKKWMEWENPYSWATTTSTYKRLHDLVMGFIVDRRAWELPQGTNIDNNLQYPDDRIISGGSKGWEPFGYEMLIGYDSNGNPVTDKGGNNFTLYPFGTWHWQILQGNDHNDYNRLEIGLPAEGWYKKADGTVVWAKFEYILRETGIWKDLKKNPVEDPEISWFSNVVPINGKSGNGEHTIREFNRDIGQDPLRIMNGAGYDLWVEKDWVGGSFDAREVYVKIYRRLQDGTKFEDFTEELARDVGNNSLIGYLSGSYANMIDADNKWIVFTPSNAKLYIDKVLKTHPNASSTNLYEYWLQEVGYKDKHGQIHMFTGNGANQSDVNSSDLIKLTPTYTGVQLNNGNNIGITLKGKGLNTLGITNTPVRDFAVIKKWQNSLGEDISATDSDVPNELKISITQTRTRQSDGTTVTEPVKFNGGTQLTLTKENTANKVVLVAQDHPGDSGSQSYSYSNYETNQNVGAWALYISGLEENYEDANGDLWTCTYKITEDSTGIPVSFVTEVSANGIIDRDNRNITITNVRMDGGMLKVIKQIADGSDYETEDPFEITVKLTPAEGEAAFYLDPGKTIADYIEVDTEDTILLNGPTITGENNAGTVIIITLTLAGRGSFTIRDIKEGTIYEVSEGQTTGWQQKGEIEYSNSTKTIVQRQLDTATITNEEVETSLKIQKVFDGNVTLTEEQKQNVTFTVTGPNDFSETFTYGVDVAEGYEWSDGVHRDPSTWDDGVLTITKIASGDYTVVENHHDLDTMFPNGEGIPEGKQYTHSWTYKVGDADANDGGDPDSGATAAVIEGSETIVLVTNTYDEASKGALKIQKSVEVNGQDAGTNQYSYVDGEYTFTVTGPTTAADQVTKYVKIKVQNGKMVSYQIADADTEDAWTAADLVEGVWALVEELEAGDYTIAEAATDGMTVSSITGGKNDADTGARRITVQVTAGDTTAEEASAQATFTNNRSLIEIKIIKIDESTRNASQKKLPGATFKLYRYEVPEESTTGTGNYVVYPDENHCTATTSTANDDSYGTLTFGSLPDGYYKISETVSPAGYTKSVNNDFYFDIVNGAVTRYKDAYTGTARSASDEIGETTETEMITYVKTEKTFTVGNEPGAALPSTGGPGTRAITLAGLALTLLALAGIVQKRKG